MFCLSQSAFSAQQSERNEKKNGDSVICSPVFYVCAGTRPYVLSTVFFLPLTVAAERDKPN